MKVKEKKWIRLRIQLVAILFVIGLGVVLARAYQLQIMERDKLSSMARSGYRGIVKLPSKRGTIYDRQGHELAVSVEVGSIYAHPHLVRDKNSAAKELTRILNDKYERLVTLLNSTSSFVWIKRKVPPEQVRRAKALGLEGVGFAAETQRYYPNKEIAAHLIGFVGQDNQGLEGIETRYDGFLKGPELTLIQLRDALGRPFSMSRPISYGDAAHNLILTIDKDIQYKAEQALALGVEKAKAKSGQCIIMNPETGEILAMAVAPAFNPNIFQKYPPPLWRNRTITDCYEPGSSMKAFLLAAALDEGAVSPETRFDCEMGKIRVSNHTIHDTKPHGILSVSEIVTLSSNIGAMKVGQKLTYQKFHKYLKRFGFGDKTQVDFLGEREGFVRSVKETRELDRATVFFGQGISMTSLQLASAMVAIANDGKLMRPFVVKRIMDQSGRVIKENYPYMVRRVIQPEVARKTRLILEGVVSDKGTAPTAAITGYSAGGKTGTSQKIDPVTKGYSHKDYIAIFVGFVPVDKPKLVILVAIDEPRGTTYGGAVAGPVFSMVGGWALNQLRVNPQVRLAKQKQDRGAETLGTVTSDAAQGSQEVESGQIPDFTGQRIRDVLKRGRDLGLHVVPEGTGLAFSQAPHAGVPIHDVSMVTVKFKPPL